MQPEEPSQRKLRTALANLLANQKTLKVATAGGPTSPWVNGTYFVESDPFTLYFTLEKRGKGMANVLANRNVAIAIDSDDPFSVFAQAEGTARIVEGSEAQAKLGSLIIKVPEIQPLLKGELDVVAVDVRRWYVTSVPDGWFPAKTLEPEHPRP